MHLCYGGKQDALGSVTGLHYDSKYFRIAKENGELCMVSGSLNITMICLRFSWIMLYSEIPAK